MDKAKRSLHCGRLILGFGVVLDKENILTVICVPHRGRLVLGLGLGIGFLHFGLDWRGQNALTLLS